MSRKLLAVVATFVFIFSVPGQTQRPVYLSQAVASGSVKGFYEYLPADYSSSLKNYPLIIWVHGSGQGGQGNSADLPKVLQYGLPKNISEGGFPASFNSGGTAYSFIVISPQFLYGWPTGSQLTGMINYVVSNYRIDPDRIYLMGMSAGGGTVWDCASMNTANSNRLAAIVPFCGALAPTQAKANIIAAGKLPVWTFHNTNDGTVPVQQSRNWVNYINAYVPAVNPAARITEFPVQSSNAVIAHDSWSSVLVPTYKPYGLNIYEWLLQYKRRISPANAVPQSNAGTDIGIVLPADAVLDGSLSTDPDGMIISYKWKKISGPSSYTFVDSTVSRPTVRNLAAGSYEFELTVTDNQGATGTDRMQVSVYPEIPPGAQQRVLIDIGNGGNTASPSINGYSWNNMTSALPGIRVSNAVSTSNTPTSIGLEVINRIDGTYSTGQAGTGSGNNAVVVGDYPGTATTDHALVHSSATNGRWKIFGLDPAKVYAIKFWGARTNTTASRSIEIKRSDDNVWLTYNATGNTNFNNAAVFNISGKTEMIFDIRTKAGSDFSCINVVDISYNNGNAQPPANAAPIARAGNDITITYPSNSVTLSGCTSSDPENAPLTYRWVKISGPQGTISNDTQCSTTVSAMVTGNYIFELTVTDTGGLQHSDRVNVTANPAGTPWPPPAAPSCAQPYKVVVIGSSTAYGTGASPLDSSWVSKFRTYVQRQNAQVNVTNLGVSGFTSYQALPTGNTPPFNRPAPDTEHNITMAMSLDPDAIIINLPTNDIASGYTLQECQDNLNALVAAAADVPVWVTTTQPRSGLTPEKTTMLITLRDWINQRFGNKAVDFWTTVGNDDGTVNAYYDAGDGLHLNNYGHHVFFTRIVGEKIWDTICNRINNTPPANQSPIARAGADAQIQLPANSIFLDGRSSTDPDGSISTYQWNLVTGPSGSQVLTPAKDTTSVTFGSAGTYVLRLTVTDNAGAATSDDVQVTVQPAVVAGSGRVVRVNVFGGTNPYTNAQWNNWNTMSNLNSSNFNFEDGTASSINAGISAAGGISDNGATYASTATVCPPAVLRYNSYNSSYRTLTIRGLNPSTTYDLEFYASRANTGNRTVIQIDNKYDTINTDNNINDFASFSNVTPPANGTVTIRLDRIGTYHYLAGFVIRESSGSRSGVSASPPLSLQNNNITPNTVAAGVYPNPFTNYIQVNEIFNGKYAIQLTDISGKVMWKSSGNTTRISETINTMGLKKGIYVLQLITDKDKLTYKLIKN